MAGRDATPRAVRWGNRLLTAGLPSTVGHALTRREVSGRLVGPPVFNTGERFVTTSGGFDSRPPPLTHRLRLIVTTGR